MLFIQALLSWIVFYIKTDTMINLKEVLTEYSEKKKYKLSELGEGKYSIDIAMKLKDGS